MEKEPFDTATAIKVVISREMFVVAPFSTNKIPAAFPAATLNPRTGDRFDSARNPKLNYIQLNIRKRCQKFKGMFKKSCLWYKVDMINNIATVWLSIVIFKVNDRPKALIERLLRGITTHRKGASLACIVKSNSRARRRNCWQVLYLYVCGHVYTTESVKSLRRFECRRRHTSKPSRN